jgi:nucleoside-diphosphate-sugar epimerase
MNDRQRTLITGGSGFIGSCLAQRLVGAGHDVHLLLRGGAGIGRLRAIEGRYTAHYADLRDVPALRKAIAASRPDVIYHLAAHGAHSFQQDRMTMLATNVVGTANLLDALADSDFRALIHVGSSSEYGHRDEPMREADRVAPRSDYGVTKAAATLLCQAEAYNGRPVSTVRVFSAYGPGEEPSRLVPYVMGCCLRGEEPQVTTGDQPRDFVFVEDVVDLLIRVPQCTAAHGRILHAGAGRPQRVRDMVEMIMQVCAAGRLTARYGARPMRPDEPETWLASIEQTTALTGWRPRFDLRSGVERTWEWFYTNALPKAA